MPSPVALLAERLQAAIEDALGAKFAGADPVLRRAAQRQFGDYQANAAMALAKRIGRPPREVATAIVDHLDVDDLCERVEVAGPGFVNLTLTSPALGAALQWLLDDERLGVEGASPAERVVVDYSSPNLAKEMQVHHLRTTIIGDALVRVLSFLGHEVIPQNHFGDWGTQFGMLVQHMIELGAEPGSTTLRDLNAFYRDANERFKADAAFAERSRARVVALQAGDADTLAHWRAFVEESQRHANETYVRLGVLLTDDDIRSESSYNDVLPEVARELEEAGVAVVDDGALVVFSERYESPLIVRKSDGGYLYGTTDLAAVRYRVRELGATQIVYVVGAPQAQHLAQVFEAAERMGWLGDKARAVHVPFGSVLGQDRRMLRTRSGESIRLDELLDEAVVRAAAKVAEANPDLDEEERADVARAVGIGAVKYADLATDRIKDYVFDWDRMLAFEGNTGPYLQYAHARIRSIFRRAEVEGASLGGPDGGEPARLVITHDAERALVIELLGFADAVASVGELLQPHRLCTYLFDLAQAFTTFYESCPVLRAAEDVRRCRLVLCEVTSRTLATGLSLLGIESPERM